MKTRLLFTFLFTLNFLFPQAPTDYIGRYNFDNGSLSDEVNGIGSLSNPSGQPSNYTITDGWDNTSNSALDVVNVLLLTGSFPQVVQEYSYSFWLNTTSNISNARDIFRRLNNNQNVGNFMSSGGITIQLVDGKVKGFVRPVQNGVGGILAEAETNVISDGNWHHIVISVKRVFNSNLVGWEIEAFQDGTSIASAQTNFYFTSQNPRITTSNQSLWIGNNGQSFSGKIDDIRIFDRGLSLQEVVDTQNNPGVVIFNDPNFKSWFVNNTLINTNGNTEIEFVEATAYNGSVTTPNLNIVDVLGIEEFPNVTSIDVSDNIISFADFSKNTNLTSIDVSNNSLASLNLQNNNNTAIATYDSTGNSNLLCVTVDDVNYSNTNWTSKDSQTNFATVCDTSPIYVNDSATGANDGSSWANAFTDLNMAINANPLGIFWIAEGSYIPGTSRSDSFVLNDDVQLYGGFDGTETIRSQRDPQNNVTILSGDINGDDTGAASFSNTTLSDNSYRVVRMLGNNAIIDGVTISGGNANHPSDNNLKEGAGIWISGTGVSNIKILNCKVIGNRSSRGGAIRGGTDGSGNSVSIERTLIAENYAEFAPVFYNVQNNGDIDITFSNCVIRENVCARANNTAASEVAGIWIRTQNSGTTTTTIVNSTITDNTSLNSPSSSLFIVPTRSQSGSGTFNLYNSIVANNQGSNNNEFTPVGINSGFSSQTLVFNHNLTSIGLSGGSGSGNIIASPTFVDASMDDYQLASGSMGIDVGDNALVQANTAEDYLGNDRIFNTTVDMGAFEFNSSLSNNDFNTQKVEIKLYPNPTTTILNIEVNNYQIQRVEIYDMLGKQIINTTETEINVSKLKSGIYLLKAKTTLGEVVKRFIKQ